MRGLAESCLYIEPTIIALLYSIGISLQLQSTVTHLLGLQNQTD